MKLSIADYTTLASFMLLAVLGGNELFKSNLGETRAELKSKIELTEAKISSDLRIAMSKFDETTKDMKQILIDGLQNRENEIATSLVSLSGIADEFELTLANLPIGSAAYEEIRSSSIMTQNNCSVYYFVKVSTYRCNVKNLSGNIAADFQKISSLLVKPEYELVDVGMRIRPASLNSDHKLTKVLIQDKIDNLRKRLEQVQ